MPGVVAPPDLEADLIAHMRAAATVDALAGAISWRVEAPYPCLRLIRVGGPTDSILRVDQALIQLEAWGAPNVDTSTQRVALAALLAVADAELVGNVSGMTTARAVYQRVRPLSRGQWAPDETTHQQRYFSRHLVAAHAV